MHRLALAVAAAAAFPVTASAQPPLPRVATGDLYVSDFDNDRIAVYDGAGNYLRSFTAPGLNGPRGIAFANGRIYVSSQFTNSVYVFSTTETYIKQLTHASLAQPTGISEGANGEIFVSGYTSRNVCVFTAADAWARSIALLATSLPNCAAFDGRGHLWVSDVSGSRILELDTSEQIVGNYAVGVSSPMSIARDHCDNLWVSGGASDNLVRFTTAGAYVDQIPTGALTGPQGIAFDDRGHMFWSSFYQDYIVELDADGKVVQTITAGGLSTPRSLAFAPTGSPSITRFGCGVNPPTSIAALSGAPRIGTTVSVALDNPLATQPAGSTTAVLLGAFARYTPCGFALGGFGLAGPGAPGEFLLDFGTPVIVIEIAPPGLPGTASLPIPDDCDIVGWNFYLQGVLVDATPGAPVPIGMTDALELLIGG